MLGQTPRKILYVAQSALFWCVAPFFLTGLIAWQAAHGKKDQNCQKTYHFR